MACAVDKAWVWGEDSSHAPISPFTGSVRAGRCRAANLLARGRFGRGPVAVPGALSACPSRVRHGGDHDGPDGHVHHDEPGDG